MQDFGITIQPCKSLHVNKGLLGLVNVLEQVLHFNLTKALKFFLVLGLRLLDFLDLLFLGKLNFIKRLLHGLHDFVCHSVMSLRDFLL